tara:strand:- start:1406 stop:1546 length:141 start_codon:yes stop_codon:yes gene_type:complete
VIIVTGREGDLMISKATQVVINTAFGVGFLVLFGAIFVVNRALDDK